MARHRRIDISRPAADSAGEIYDVFEPRFLKESNSLGAAHTAFAVSDDFAIRVKLLNPLRQLAKRYSRRRDSRKEASQRGLKVGVGK